LYKPDICIQFIFKKNYKLDGLYPIYNFFSKYKWDGGHSVEYFLFQKTENPFTYFPETILIFLKYIKVQDEII